jgi:serine/threonine-protein kinase
MGEVYLAVAVGPAGFEKTVALKVLTPQLSDDPDRIRELLREALIGVELRHPNVVEVLDLGCEDGRHFIVMEYVRGYNLARVLEHTRRGSPMPVTSAVHLTWAVADALDYLHNVRDPSGRPLGLVHGDVSATNILLGIDGLVKLSDFGVATFVRDVTRPTSVAGKLPYMPPEAFRGAERAQHWDAYALGVVLYQCITNHLPYPGKSLAAVMESMERGAPSPRELRTACDSLLNEMIMHAIHPDPAQRFHSADDFRRALDSAHPRLVEDAAKHRRFVQRIYDSEDWIEQYGELPTTGRIPGTEDIDGYLTVEEDATVDVRPPRPLRIGLSPARGAKAARAYGQRLSAVLEKRVNRHVRTTAFADYTGLIDALSSGQVDIAWMPPVPFVEAAERGAGIMVAVQRSGLASYRSVLFVRDSSPFHTLEDLRGESVAWVDPESSSGYLAAAVLLTRKLGPPDEIFSEQHFHGSHRAVCEAVLNGWASVGATYASIADDGSYTSSGWEGFLGSRAKEIRPIAVSDPIPGDNIAYRPGLPSRMIEELTRVFINLSRDNEGSALLADVFGADELVRVERVEYAGVRPLLELVRANRARDREL